MNWQPVIDAAAGWLRSWTLRFMVLVIFFWLLVPQDVFVRWVEAVWPQVSATASTWLRAASREANATP